VSAIWGAFCASGKQVCHGPGVKTTEDHPKKKSFSDPNRQSEAVQAQRATWAEQLPTLPAGRLIAIDEMGACLDLCPVYGRALKGQRAYGLKPTSRGPRISTVGALGIEGLKTALCFEGTLNGQVFLFFLEHFLRPLLRPGDIVLLDNAKAHHVEPVREVIEQAGAQGVYLPPYSPDLNPIELAWSKVKHYLRKAQARTLEALYQAIANALQTISSKDAYAFFRHVGLCI
jgi:transposase